MFGLGFPEIAMILVIALIVLGPSKLPELARSLGKGLKEFRKATDDFKSTINDELYKPDAHHPAPHELPRLPDEAPKDSAPVEAVTAPPTPASPALPTSPSEPTPHKPA
jgi:TatA/E family protein of Tat protein translocase